MRRTLAVFIVAFQCALPGPASAQSTTEALSDSAAVNDAVATVDTMGGVAIWKNLESVHFVHEWDVANRSDRYLENEILKLTGPRSYVTMESEIYSRTRAYSPEHRYWSITDGKFAYGSDEALERAMERAPYSLYRLARTVARKDRDISVRYGTIEGVSNQPDTGTNLAEKGRQLLAEWAKQ